MNTPDHKRRSIKPWLIAGIVFLFILAAFSSVDSSLVYIFLGLTTFCFFMALRGWISTQPWKNKQSGYQQQEKSRSDFSFDEKFNRGSKQQQHQSTYQQPSSPEMSADSKKIAKRIFTVIAAFITFCFLLITFVLIFGDDDFEVEKQYYNDQAELYLGNNEYDSAQVNYRRVLKLRPDDIAARIGYGKALYFKEQYDSAIIMFNGVNELEPENVEAKLFRGRCYYYQKRYPEAMNEAQQLLAGEPDYGEALLLAGDILYAQQNFEEALTKYYEPAYAGGARSMMLCWIMAYIYDEKKKDLEKAIPLYKEALTYDDTVVDIYTRLSQITQEPEAEEYRRKAAELQSKQIK